MQQVPERYQIEKEIGRGGMGVVYQAFDVELKRPVAIKSIRPKWASNPEIVARLKREALSAAAIDHPYLCKVYELFASGSETLVVMEFVEGETLAALLQREFRLYWAQAVRYAAETAEALAAAHQRHLIHRDVKPANIMITAGHIKLMDFGLAKDTHELAPESDEQATVLTRVGALTGTVNYMAPEQACGDELTAKADVFALGATLYQSLSGQLPFAGETTREYFKNLISGHPRDLPEDIEVPDQLRDLLKECLQKDPEKRPDAEIVARRLSDLSHSQPGLGSSWIGGKWLPSLALVLLLLLLAALLFQIFKPDRPQDLNLALQPVRQRQLITWPSDETEGRISPDLRFIAFLSNRDGSKQIWLRRLAGGDARAITNERGDLKSLIWSPEGNSIGYLVEESNQTLFHVVPAFFGGASKLTLSVEGSSPRLLRWVGQRLYLTVARRGEQQRSVWRMDLTTGQWEKIYDGSPSPFKVTDVDISPDERELVLAALDKGKTDLWSVDLENGKTRRLTDDPYREASPRWTQDRVIFLSDRSGQPDLWLMLPTSKAKMAQLTLSPQEEKIDDVSKDGTVMLLRVLQQNANLWRLDPQRGEETYLTADSLSDFWPSIADNNRLVFQRANPSLDPALQGARDADILIAELAQNLLRGEGSKVAEGFFARISPDGDWLAFLRQAPESSPSEFCAEVWVRNLHNQRMWQVSDCYRLPSFDPYPLNWEEQNLVWGPENALYFAGYSVDAGRRIESCRVTLEGPSCQVIATAPEEEIPGDLAVSADGSSLAYVVTSAGGGESRLEVWSSSEDRSRVLIPDQTGYLSNKGWLERDSVIVVRSASRLLGEVEILKANLRGVEKLGEAGLAIRFNSRLDTRAAVLYQVLSEASVQNIHAFRLRDRKWTQITDNRWPNVNFSGLEIATDGSILYSRHIRNHDLWLQLVGEPPEGWELGSTFQ